ncbi:branched-chain amino acid transport system ATP-binding protein [Bradyrhizobium sp. LA6.10]|uniref:ABC transporter ATP-binding protein n=1 Tax=unclassified Bradyrhizobium TaxID=2631580 RepID=UPI00339549F8
MLACENLEVFYGAVAALKGINLQIERGEIVALLGSNGAGKTTLLRTLSGLVRPRSGELTFDGVKLGNISPERRVKMGLAHVPEGRRVFPGLTVLENLIVATNAWRRRGESIEGDLDSVMQLFPRLRERAKQHAWSLSGGEQQMLAIGRALMSRPRLLLLDEPSLGLAPRIAEELYEKISDINLKGVTVLLVEQNTVLALSVARRAYVIELGRLIIEGASEEIANDPRVREAYLGADAATVT